MRLSVAVAVALLSASILPAAEPVQAAIRKSTHIPAQTLGTALQALAKQRAFQVIHLSDGVDALKTQGASGDLTPDEALEQLLNGTGLTYRYLDETTVTVFSADAPPDVNGSSGALIGIDEAGSAAPTALHLAQADVPSSSSSMSEGSSATDSYGQLEQIIVTAQKHGAQLLQDVPLSISAISDESLRRTGSTGFSDYLATVPSVAVVGQGPGQKKLVIRGISSNLGAETQATVGVYLDEVPVTHSGAPAGGVAPYDVDLSPVDIARVEVLRGPQGTLYGASSMGGTVRLITNQPDLTEFQAKAHAELSSTHTGGENMAIDGVANLPITDKLGARVVAFKRTDDGYIFNAARNIPDVDDLKVTGGRAILRAEPTDKLSITGTFNYQRMETDGRSNDDSPQGFPAFTQNRYSEEGLEDRSNLYNLVINYEHPWGRLISSTSYEDRKSLSERDTNMFLSSLVGTPPLPGALGQDYNNINRFIQELRFTAQLGERTQWLMGAYYYDQDQALLQRFPAPGFDAATGIDTASFGAFEDAFQGNIFRKIKEQALFSEITFDITDRLQLLWGLRWFDVDQEFRSHSTGFFNGGDTAGNASTSERDTTQKYSLSYKATQDVLFYATASQGYRIGGNSEVIPEATCGADLAAIGLTVDSASRYSADSLWNYEIGLKSAWLNRRLTVDVAVFDIDWSGLQTVHSLACGFGFTENAGRAETKGVELELHAALIDGLVLSVSGSYVDAAFAEDTPNLGASEGDRLPAVPDLSANVSAEYNFPIHADLMGYVRADWMYVSERYTNFTTAGQLLMPAYDILGVRAGVTRANWEVALFARNVLDEHAVLMRSLASSANSITPNQPRTVGIDLHYSF